MIKIDNPYLHDKGSHYLYNKDSQFLYDKGNHYLCNNVVKAYMIRVAIINRIRVISTHIIM